MKRNLPSNTGHRDSYQDKLLQLIYNHALGRALILPFTHPAISKIGGYVLDSPASRILIPFFVRSAHIDLSQCERPAGGRYRSFNDLFTRRLLPEARPFDPDPLALVSPCDARLTAYPISARRVFHIKATGWRTCCGIPIWPAASPGGRLWYSGSVWTTITATPGRTAG